MLTESLSVNRNEVIHRDQIQVRLDQNTFPNINEKAVQNLNAPTNNFSIINLLLASMPLSEDHFLIQLQKFVNSMLWFRCLDIREFIGLETNRSYIDEYIILNSLTKDFEAFLKETSGQVFTFQRQ